MSDFARMMEMAMAADAKATEKALGMPDEAPQPTPASMPTTYGPGKQDATDEHKPASGTVASTGTVSSSAAPQKK